MHRYCSSQRTYYAVGTTSKAGSIANLVNSIIGAGYVVFAVLKVEHDVGITETPG